MEMLLLFAGVAPVKEGQEIELKIGYNGGHKSATLNFFNVRYACGAAKNGDSAFKKIGPTNKDTINCNPPCKQLTVADIVSVDGAAASTTNYPIDATQSRQSGYVSVSVEYSSSIMHSRFFLCFP